MTDERTNMNISVTYNQNGNHEACATETLNGVEYYCICNGLSGWGEADFCDNFITSKIGEEERAALRDAAYQRVKREWDYNGSEWSEPVDEPSDELVDEPDDDHQFAVAHTEFHGGAVKGYAVSEESAEEWVKFLTAGTDCVCGCYVISLVNKGQL